MQVKMRLIAHPLHYHRHHHLRGTAWLSTQNLLAQEADLLQDMNCSFILVGIQRNECILFNLSILHYTKYFKIHLVFFNGGDETTQNIKRLNFSLSQSNEIQSIFLYHARHFGKLYFSSKSCYLWSAKFSVVICNTSLYPFVSSIVSYSKT